MLLIDGDVVVYQVGFSCDKDSLSLQENFEKVEEFINSMKKETNTTEYKIYLTASDDGINVNFRKTLYEEYKKQRNTTHKPVFYDEIREFLIKRFNTEVIYGQEADDAMGLSQTDDTIICTVDKDLMMVSGWHYNWRKVDEGLVFQTPREGFRCFCMQCLTGDSVDNIPGMFKILGKKATKKVKDGLWECNNREEMWNYIKEVYKGYEDELLLISKLLWIRHTHNILRWQDEEFN